MRATIIVRSKRTNSIVDLVDVYSIDEVTVNTVVRYLRDQYPCETHVIDQSQIEYARQFTRAA